MAQQTQSNQLDLDALRGRSKGTMGAVQGAVGGKNVGKFKGQIKNVRQTLKDGKQAFDKTYKAAKSGNYAEAMKDARSGYKTMSKDGKQLRKDYQADRQMYNKYAPQHASHPAAHAPPSH